MNSTPKLKILVAYHKPAILIASESLVPIHVGRKQAIERANSNPAFTVDLNWLIKNMLGDDSGDNISDQNDVLNEMTAVYWAWKNYDQLSNPEWIGFSHYRRHFIGRLKDHKTIFQDINYIDARYLDNIEHGKIQKIITGNNIDFIGVNEATLGCSVYDDYKNSPNHIAEDLDLSLAIIKEKYPEMYNTAMDYLNGNRISYCNMFIMRKEVFFEYAQWVFSIIFEVLDRRNVSKRSATEKRCFFTERLTGIYLCHLQNKLTYKNLPMTYILNTDLPKEVKPRFPCESVTVIFACNDAFIPYLATSMKSLIHNCSNNRNYELYVLDNGITEENKKIVSFLAQQNVSINFISVIPYLKDVDTSLLKLHKDFAYYTPETYYRFLIPTIFKNFKKVIYLDGDTIVLNDIAKLFDINLVGNLIAASKDLYMPLWRKNDSNMEFYLKNKLKLRDPECYFQAGVLVFNVELMRKLNTQNKFFVEMSRLGSPWLQDQDVLNSVTQGQVLYISGKWNFDRNIEDFSCANPVIFSHIYRDNVLNSYNSIKSDPYIIHYAGPSKPWKNPNIIYAYLFWFYARQTPYYEKILFENITLSVTNRQHIVLNAKNREGTLLTRGLNTLQRDGFRALFKKIIKWIKAKKFCFLSI